MRYITALPGPEFAALFPRPLCILGATGSIGRSALDVVRRQPEKFAVVALAGARNARLLAEQAAEFRPSVLAVLDEAVAKELRGLLPAGYSPDILLGQEGYEAAAALPSVKVVLSAQSGAAGLRATAAAAKAGKVIALANKESLVLAGDILHDLCAVSGASILPVDSEHSAVFQCLEGQDTKALSHLVLTASGGPFVDKTADELANVTLEQALAHPSWSMGPKITVDSSTLMNKGLEIIEACRLFGLPAGKVETVVHRKSFVHSLAAYSDGSMLAHIGVPDMRVPIAHALGYPHRIATGVPRLDLAEVAALRFERPDESRFPCLRLAREALEHGNDATTVLNAANEIAVEAFLNRRIAWSEIAPLAEKALARHAGSAYSFPQNPSVESVLALDAEVRVRTLQDISPRL